MCGKGRDRKSLPHKVMVVTFCPQVHVSMSSTVADHCRVYALSDPNEPAYKEECSHSHGESCDRCLVLLSTLTDIENSLFAQVNNMQEDEHEELSFVVKQAKSNILAWKAHILRSIHQDSARIDLMDSLDESSVFLVQDWAMKFLPRKYRESQTDWFGKRGIPWHISVAFRKVDDEIQLMTFCHIFKTSLSDSSAVLAIMADVIKQLKTALPSLTTVFYRQDNAGCYHCGATIVCASVLGSQLSVSVKRIDFSDAQGGKGACNRKSATIKSHMQHYLNSGHDIENAEQMFDAMTSNGGVPSLSVSLCSCVESTELPPYKIDGVSLVSNIQYSAEGLRVWRAYGIGSGKLLPQQKHEVSPRKTPTLAVVKCRQSTFSAVKPRVLSKSKSKTGEEQEEEGNERGNLGDGLFACPEEGCLCRFLSHSAMIRHLDCGKHKRELEKETLYDKAAMEYGKQLEGQATSMVPVFTGTSQPRMQGASALPRGWALK